MRAAAKDLKAYSLWTDQHMSSRFGKEWVEVEEGKKVAHPARQHTTALSLRCLLWQENRDLGMWTESFGDFLRKYQGKVLTHIASSLVTPVLAMSGQQGQVPGQLLLGVGHAQPPACRVSEHLGDITWGTENSEMRGCELMHYVG